MKKGTLVLYDRNEAYIRALGEFLSAGRLPMEVEVFTRADKLKEYAAAHRQIFLLADEEAFEELNGLPAERKVWLTASARKEGSGEEPTIGKYQSAERILSKIAQLAGAGEQTEEKGFRKERPRPVSMAAEAAGVFEAKAPPVWENRVRASIRAVYSPVGRCGKTGFAVVLGEVLGEDHSALYINLEEYAAWETDGQESGGSLTDLLYYARQQDEQLIFKLSSMVRTWKNLDYIRPSFSGWDLKDVRAEEWEYFLARITGESDYEQVILDVGAGLVDLPELLEVCDRIYVPVTADPAAKRKIARFMENLQASGHGHLLRRMVRLTLPLLKEEQQTMDPARLLRTPLGDFVRRLLSSEEKSAHA